MVITSLLRWYHISCTVQSHRDASTMALWNSPEVPVGSVRNCSLQCFRTWWGNRWTAVLPLQVVRVACWRCWGLRTESHHLLDMKSISIKSRDAAMTCTHVLYYVFYINFIHVVLWMEYLFCPGPSDWRSTFFTTTVLSMFAPSVVPGIWPWLSCSICLASLSSDPEAS